MDLFEKFGIETENKDLYKVIHVESLAIIESLDDCQIKLKED